MKDSRLATELPNFLRTAASVTVISQVAERESLSFTVAVIVAVSPAFALSRTLTSPASTVTFAFEEVHSTSASAPSGSKLTESCFSLPAATLALSSEVLIAVAVTL